MLYRHLASLLALLPIAGCATTPAISVPETDFLPQAFADACDAWDDWDKPAPPFRIYGGTYHVGTCGITALLVTGRDGYMLIDGGTGSGGELILANIEKLGFALSDVRTISHTQEHHDHVGGFPIIKARTGARLVASPRARSVFETGVLNEDDPQFEPVNGKMETVSVDATIENEDAVVIDGKRVVAHFTPGHSPGAITWRWQECEGDRCHMILFSDGLGPFSSDKYRWSDHPEYLADYRRSIAWLANSDADICLTAHPSQMRLIERIKSGAIVDPGRCVRMGNSIMERLNMIVVSDEKP